MAVNFNVIGLMSGTSMDGLDIAYVQFKKDEKGWSFDIMSAITLPYSSEWRSSLTSARALNQLHLFKLGEDYGTFLGKCVHSFMLEKGIQNVDFIASHGHTVHHQPENGVTVQIGEGARISDQVSLPVVYDFRIQDVHLGGQGAPLVPVGDRMLFGEYDACLNLGGFSNISFEHQMERIAFDIGPVNIVLNELVKAKGVSFDQNGDFARSGNLDHVLLKQLNALSYYEQPVPKSLGLEWVEDFIYPLLADKTDVNALLNTMVEHAAFQIAKICTDYQIDSMLVTGGGVYNTYLMERLGALSTVKIIIPDPIIIEFKEALVFAFLGVLRWENNVNVLKSVTGAHRDHSSGEICWPK